MMYCSEIGDFLKPSRPQLYRKIVFIVSVIMAFTSVNIVQSPSRVLCSDVTPPIQQTLMSNICQVYNGVSSIFSNLLGGFEIYKYTATIISVISAHEDPLKVKPPKVNPFKQIWQAFKKMPSPFIRSLPPFCFAFIATYQYQVAFSDFMGSEIMKGSNAEDAGTEKNKIYQKCVSLSMMCNVMNNIVQLFYGFLNHKICEVIGMKWTMVIGNFLIAVSLLLFFCLFLINTFIWT